MIYTLPELQSVLDAATGRLSLGGSAPALYQPVAYMLGLGGKRLRPCLVLMGKNLFDDQLGAAVQLALGLELFHNFTLMHDDIMDNAPLRRGQASVHERWNRNAAILSGDAMMVMAYQTLCASESKAISSILQLFNETALQVCEGQQLDMDFERMDSVSLSQYIEMIRLKTAVLLGASLAIGALDGGASEDTCSLLYEAGSDLGLAFQLQDDLLDVYGEQEQFGKQVGGDIMAGKKTWLLINALELASASQKAQIEDLMKGESQESKVSGITSLYNDLGIRQHTERKIEELCLKATEKFRKLPCREERKENLYKLISSVSNRKN